MKAFRIRLENVFERSFNRSFDELETGEISRDEAQSQIAGKTAMLIDLYFYNKE